MCLLDGVHVGVQAPHWVVHQQLVLASSFSGCGAPNHAPLTMGIAVALLSIVTAILLRWCRIMACSKDRGPHRRFRWSAADRADNNVADMAIPLMPFLNLRRDSIAPAGAKRAMSFCLI